MSKTAALYYPNFRMNLGWLKVALLYWDRIRCIVPPDIEGGLDDRPEFATLVRERLIVNTSPKDYLDRAEDRFTEQVLPLLQGSSDKCRNQLKELERAFTRKMGKYHYGKIGSNLQSKLYRLKRGGVRIRKNGEWVVMPNHIGGMYMMCLGSVMADQLGVPLVTDTPEFERYGEFLSFGAPPPTRNKPDAQNILVHLELPFPSMQSLGRVPLDAILRFREKFAEERARFREEVEKIVDEAGKVSDPNALTDYLDDRKERIAAALKEHRTSLFELKGRTLHSLLKVSCPTVVTAAAAAGAGWLGDRGIGLLTLLGLGISAAAWWAECRGQRRDVIKKCPWHYCLKVAKIAPDGTSFAPPQQQTKRSGPKHGWK